MALQEARTLRELLSRHTREGKLYSKLDGKRVQCYACGHRCSIPSGREGICKVRFNSDGMLYVPYGYVAGLAVDPIEKKPFFHVLPGSSALSFGMLGCDYHCGYCQNWITSQALRDPVAGTPPTPVTAEKVIGFAIERTLPIITSTYNEPLITSEWSVEIFRLAVQYGILCSYVSNGNGTPEVLEYLRPYIRAYKVDLKSFRQKRYQHLGGTLGAVLDTIRWLQAAGIWTEVVTLVVPGFNDSDEELNDIARFLASVSPDIPWHLTAFHQDYRMTEEAPTAARSLLRGAEIGRAAGLHFVYAGNLPGLTGTLENTYCPSCQTLLIERRGFHVIRNSLVSGACSYCGSALPGIWK